MNNKRTFTTSDIISFIKDGLMGKKKMTKEQADELINKVSIKTIMELYSEIYDRLKKEKNERVD